MDRQENGSNPSLVPKLIILLIAVACAALVVVLYHCIRVGWCMQYHRSSPEPPRHHRHAFHFRREEQPSMDNSIADLIPVHKFNRTISDAEGGYDDHTCAICLCELEEGDEIRTLPECMHSFHAPCIDMWFYSHTSCPICRTDATPPPHVLMHFIDSDTERPAAHQDLEYRGV